MASGEAWQSQSHMDSTLDRKVELLASGPSAPMFRSSFKPLPLAFLLVLLYSLLTVALPSSIAAQKMALHLDGTPVDPFLAAPGKPVVLLFYSHGLPISNRYAPLIKKMSAEYRAKVAFWLVYPNRSNTAQKFGNTSVTLAITCRPCSIRNTCSSHKPRRKSLRKLRFSTPIITSCITGGSTICTRIWPGTLLPHHS